ncbi:uncharacterized protein LOC144629487 isoform X2 [Oculina patagonica]
MVSKTKWTSILFVLQAVLTEGKVFKGAPKADNYEDSPAFQGPALKEQSAKKDNGPPEIKENEKKSDAYEVVSDGSHNRNSDSISEDEIGGERVVKVGHPLVRLHASKVHHRSGLHIVSLDDDEEDNHGNNFREKDLRLYGSIGSPFSPSSVRHKSHRSRSRHPFYQNDYIPPNVVSLSQDDFSGPLPGSDAQTREEIFPNFRRRDPFFFSQPPQLSQPEELMQRFQPVSPKSMSYGDRPNMLLLPIYNGRADSNPALVPMTAQSAFPASPPQFGAAPAEYNSLPPTGGFRNGLLFQPALQVPQIPTQSVSSYMLPSQSEGQFLFNNQQPDVRSLYQLQSQPQMQIPQVPMPQLIQPQQSIIPTDMQMAPELLSAASQREIGPASHWVDEDGRERSEVLDRDRDIQDNDRPNYDRNEDDDDEEARHESGRYYDRDDDSQADENDDDRAQEDQTSEDQPEQSDSREDERPSDEEGRETEEPEDESSEDANSRAYGTNGPGEEDEQGPDEDDSDGQEMEPQQGRFAQQGTQQQFNPRAMPRVMAPTHPIGFPKFRSPLNTMVPPQMDARAFSRYQLMSPSSALKEHILPEPQEEPKHPLKRPHSDLQISQMSTAEAQFYENKAAMEPNFSPPIASKDTIPGKSRKFRFGLGNVLIRLNGKPLEDSSQLRSKIINGQIIQGKGKLIKSKGPVRVKLSHTKDAKHLKIIDILAPTKFHVYDTKSKIGRPSKSLLNDTNKTNTKSVI